MAMADLDLVNKHATITADTEFLVLNPVLYNTDSVVPGTGSFFYDLYLKSTSPDMFAKWLMWDTAKGGGAGYDEITGTHGGVAYAEIVTAVNSSIYKANVELDATSLGKLKIDYTSYSGTPALEYWYALRGPGLPTSLQRQGSGVGAYTREFFLHADRPYVFTTNITGLSGSVYFNWKYYDGASWVNFPDGTDASFIGVPPTSGRVQVVFTTSGSEASVWAFKAQPRF